ncbi:MAG: outer membrane beta-barrel protein [Chlamydiales bacterium]
MKKMFIAFVLAGVFSGMVQAKAGNYNACCDTGQFGGLYVGGNIGVDSYLSHRNDWDGFLTDNSGWSTNDTDVTLGFQVGYDWQCGYKLFGLVLDWNWVNNERRHRENPNIDDNSFIHDDFDWFSTIRGRAGLTVCDALVYITIGAAVTRHETTWQSLDNAGARFKAHNTQWGWTGGAGAEFLAWCNWSLGAEVLFLHFGERRNSFTDNDDIRYTFGHSNSAWVGRILLNYRFGDLLSWCCR